jgi:hypothetical protein
MMVMKIKKLLVAAFSILGISGAFAQAEYDDMYFNAEDRAQLNAQRTTEVAYNTPSKAKKFEKTEDERVNPTDTYSARNINPEYTSRAQAETSQADEEDYFANNYQYNKNQYNNWNNNFNNWYNNPWTRSNYYGSAINNWYSPYYGYNSWNSPWYDPYWSYNGWSSSFSFHYGNSWNYGWGGNYNYWNRPYYGWDPYFGGLGYYGGSYWNNYRYPGTIIVNRGESGRNIAYGRRPSRSTSIVTDRSNLRTRTSVGNSVRDEQNSGGRISTQNGRQQEYYNRYNAQRSTSNTTYDNRANTQNNRSRSWDSWNNSSDNNRSMDRSSSPSYSPARSSGSDAGTRTNTSSGSSGRRGRD